MPASLAIIAQILPLLPTIAGDVSALIKWIASIRAAATQSAQWTPELEAAFVNSLIALASDPAWQPDPSAGSSTVTTTVVTTPAKPVV
jgi:hypothetical protein